ncbi:MAG: hypothetical protein AAFR37_20305, partial [Cyanobacteria bacterium J06628_3]
ISDFFGACDSDCFEEPSLIFRSLISLESGNRVENSQDNSETMHLLKMVCPSTGFIHFLRVPPNITSAREAITWINWGIYQEEFEIQT